MIDEIPPLVQILTVTLSEKQLPVIGGGLKTKKIALDPNLRSVMNGKSGMNEIGASRLNSFYAIVVTVLHEVGPGDHHGYFDQVLW